MAAKTEVTPNRRGARSREAVLDAAERLMAEHGHEAASVSALVDEAGVPPSSIYHYFGSKEGVLLAVMERGALTLAACDGAVVAHQSHPEVGLGELLEHLPAALTAVRRDLGRPRPSAGLE